jgi:hypothetical protein
MEQEQGKKFVAIKSEGRLYVINGPTVSSLVTNTSVSEQSGNWSVGRGTNMNPQLRLRRRL